MYSFCSILTSDSKAGTPGLFDTVCNLFFTKIFSEYCNWSVNEDDTCKNCNCPSGAGTELPSTVTVFDIRMHIADHTGNLMNCKLTQAVAKHLCQCSVFLFSAHLKLSSDPIKNLLKT